MVAPAETEELPRANVKRIIKARLAELTKSQFNQERDVPVQKEAFQAFAESTRIFIHYLSAAANDVCREGKRQTINTEDVLRALEELEFREFVEPLKACLEGFNVKKSSSKKAAAAAPAKRKATSVSSKGKKVRNVVEVPVVRNNKEVPTIDDDEDDDTM